MSMYFPNLLELSLRRVLAFPKAFEYKRHTESLGLTMLGESLPPNDMVMGDSRRHEGGKPHFVF